MNRKQTRNSLLVIFLLVLALGVSTIPVEAEPNATIHPSEGTVYTDIFLQVRGLEVFVAGDNWPGFRDMELYLYWDNEPLILGLSDPGSYDDNKHYFDVHLSPPNTHPFSDLGNHTIYIEIYKDWATYLCNFTLTFEIIEYLPCDEWLALNATYASLLANYSDLLGDYNSLLADYYLIVAEHDDLQDEFSLLSADYNALLDSYDSLVAHFEMLNSAYHGLEVIYESLNSSYYDLVDICSDLQSDYDDLQEDYGSLSASYDDLTTSYDDLSASYDSLQGLYESLLEDYADLLKDYDSLDSDYDAMKEEYISLESDHNSLETSYNTLNSTYNDLKSGHETLTANLGTTRISSYAFIIVAILFIGTTAYLAMRSRKLKR